MTVFVFLQYIMVLAQSDYWNFSSPYNISLKKDLITAGFSMSVYFTGSLILENEDPPRFETGSFTLNDILKINCLDRNIAGRWDLNAETTGLIIRKVSRIGSSLSILLFPGKLESRGSLCLIYIEGLLLTQGITSFTKGITDRYRPFTYLTLNQINLLDESSRNRFMKAINGDDIEDSFFSGDASTTAYSLIFLAKVFNDYFPDSGWKYGVWGLGITGSALEAYFRAKSGKHFPTDVITGSLIGGSLGFLIPQLHKKNQIRKLSLYPLNQGISLNYRF